MCVQNNNKKKYENPIRNFDRANLSESSVNWLFNLNPSNERLGKDFFFIHIPHWNDTNKTKQNKTTKKKNLNRRNARYACNKANLIRHKSIFAPNDLSSFSLFLPLTAVICLSNANKTVVVQRSVRKKVYTHNTVNIRVRLCIYIVCNHKTYGYFSRIALKVADQWVRSTRTGWNKNSNGQIQHFQNVKCIRWDFILNAKDAPQTHRSLCGFLHRFSHNFRRSRSWMQNAKCQFISFDSVGLLLFSFWRGKINFMPLSIDWTFFRAAAAETTRKKKTRGSIIGGWRCVDDNDREQKSNS